MAVYISEFILHTLHTRLQETERLSQYKKVSCIQQK